MLHASSQGETFGLSVGEFSTLNKPIITSIANNYCNSHIEILGDKAIIYNNYESILSIFKNISSIIKKSDEWNAYANYEPINVMKQFYNVFNII
jgi:hypothetical protein